MRRLICAVSSGSTLFNIQSFNFTYKLLFKRQFVKNEKLTTNVVWNLAPKELHVMFAFIKLYEISWLKWNYINDINLFITQFVLRFFLFFFFLPGSSQTDDPGKYKKVLSKLIEHAEALICKNPKLYWPILRDRRDSRAGQWEIKRREGWKLTNHLGKICHWKFDHT